MNLDCANGGGGGPPGMPSFKFNACAVALIASPDDFVIKSNGGSFILL